MGLSQPKKRKTRISTHNSHNRQKKNKTRANGAGFAVVVLKPGLVAVPICWCWAVGRWAARAAEVARPSRGRCTIGSVGAESRRAVKSPIGSDAVASATVVWKLFVPRSHSATGTARLAVAAYLRAEHGDPQLRERKARTVNVHARSAAATRFLTALVHFAAAITHGIRAFIATAKRATAERIEAAQATARWRADGCAAIRAAALGGDATRAQPQQAKRCQAGNHPCSHC